MHRFHYLEEEWNEKMPSKSNCCNELLNKDSTSSEFMKWDNKALSSLFWKFFICFGEYLSFLLLFLVGVESDSLEHFRLLISECNANEEGKSQRMIKKYNYISKLLFE